MMISGIYDLPQLIDRQDSEKLPGLIPLEEIKKSARNLGRSRFLNIADPVFHNYGKVSLIPQIKTTFHWGYIIATGHRRSR
jgi:hypothetical protein